MLRNEKGFTFYEAVISLNVLILFCGLIVPAVISLLIKKEQALLLSNAEDLLTDSVYAYFLNKEEFNVGNVIKDGRSYEIILKNRSISSVEICINWNERLKENELCEEVSE